MTKTELLARVRRDRPGESTEDEMRLWIRQLEQRWHDEVVMTHEGFWDPETVLDIGSLSATAWWGADSTATGCGLTAARRGPRIEITGTATENCYIWINGPALAIETSVNPMWSYGSPMVGPEAGAWNINYAYATEGTATSMKIAKSTNGESQMTSSITLPRGRTYALSGTNTQLSEMSMSLYAGSGSTFPAGWAVVILLDEGEIRMPMDRIRRDLLIPETDEETYVYWLYSKIDFRLGEMERYNNDAMMFNSAMGDAAKRWHRHHMPLGRPVIHNIRGHGLPKWYVEDPLNQRRRGE